PVRHDQQGHRLRRVEPRLVQVLPRSDAAPRDPAQPLGPQACGGHEVTETTERTALVELTDVNKRYGTVRALEGVSLQVHAGEITCVLGDNGAGKSTLIKMIAGLHQHDGGTLGIDGEETRLSSPREALDRGIATVYQDLAVVPLMPVWRNF